MKTRTAVLLLVTLVVGAGLCFAADPNMGTWKLNEAKSKIDAGMPKNLYRGLRNGRRQDQSHGHRRGWSRQADA